RMRSGTTALREVLATNHHILQLGEVFHSEYLEDQRFFYNYFKERIVKNPNLALPSGDNRRVLFRDYVSDVKQRLGYDASMHHVLVVGVNYNSLQSLNNFWQNSLSPPYLLELIQTFNFGVLHLIRENLLRTLISERRARASGVWHIRSEADRASVAV